METGITNSADFVEAMARLGHKPHSKGGAAALGLSFRHYQRLSSGESVIPLPIQKLVQSLLREQRAA